MVVLTASFICLQENIKKRASVSPRNECCSQRPNSASVDERSQEKTGMWSTWCRWNQRTSLFSGETYWTDGLICPAGFRVLGVLGGMSELGLFPNHFLPIFKWQGPLKKNQNSTCRDLNGLFLPIWRERGEDYNNIWFSTYLLEFLSIDFHLWSQDLGI